MIEQPSSASNSRNSEAKAQERNAVDTSYTIRDLGGGTERGPKRKRQQRTYSQFAETNDQQGILNYEKRGSFLGSNNSILRSGK